MMSSVLLIFNHAPYDGIDVTRNALRLAGQLEATGHEVRIFLMNDSVDLARNSNRKPLEHDQDLSQPDASRPVVQVMVCGICIARCGIHKQEPYVKGAEKLTMAALPQWTVESDKLLTF